MYLLSLVKESVVRNEIESNESVVKNEFETSFSLSEIYDKVTENLEVFLNENLIQSYEDIKEFSQNYAISYLLSKSKEIADRG